VSDPILIPKILDVIAHILKFVNGNVGDVTLLYTYQKKLRGAKRINLIKKGK